MIVRINQIDMSRIEHEDGWPPGSTAGALHGSWPADARAFELLILSQDEKQQPLTDDFRQHQLRHMVPQAAIALLSSEETPLEPLSSIPAVPLVVRLDGRVACGELLSAWYHLTEPDGSGPFAFSSTLKPEPEVGDAWGSVRVVPSWRRLSDICTDTTIGLERSVRLRLLAVPPLFLSEMLDAGAPDDLRWMHLLNECQFYCSTTPDLKSLQFVVRRMDASQVKAKIMQRLMAVARGEPAIPE